MYVVGCSSGFVVSTNYVFTCTKYLVAFVYIFASVSDFTDIIITV